MVEPLSNITVTIMGRRGSCTGKYKSGPRKGRACASEGSIRINGKPWCGSHVRGELRSHGSPNEFMDLGIADLQDKAEDKHLACGVCNLLYSAKTVTPGMYRNGKGDKQVQVCNDCFKDITSCEECQREAIHPCPWDEVERGDEVERPCKLAYCERHYLAMRKEAYACNHMDCEEEVAKPHPDYPHENAWFYCDSHYEAVKNRGEILDLYPDEEELFIGALVKELAVKLIESWGKDIACKTLERLIERLQQEHSLLLTGDQS